MGDRLTVIPGHPDCRCFAAYPVAQVLMARWGHHRPGTWYVSVFVSPELFGMLDVEAVMDDFGSLVVVRDEQR